MLARGVRERVAFGLCWGFPLWLSVAHGQSVVSEYAQNTNFPVQQRLSEEKILRISNTRRVFIISSANQGFLPGDYITLLHQGRHVARAIVAKQQDSRAGIKIIKIYSPALWGQLKTGLAVKILRGDDSYFINQESSQDKDQDELAGEVSKIMSEEDLFNSEAFLQEDLAEDRKKGLFETDNLIAVGVGLVSTIDPGGEAAADLHFGYSFARQLASNIWGEFAYGYSNLQGFPDVGITTSLQTFTLRVKYVFAAPFHSFIMPYIGYKFSVAIAPKADPARDEKTPEQQAELLDDVALSGPIVGASVFKRLVPGWFVRMDVGTDFLALGVAVEF